MLLRCHGFMACSSGQSLKPWATVQIRMGGQLTVTGARTIESGEQIFEAWANFQIFKFIEGLIWKGLRLRR
jgi:hypothetical protein